ncbi:MAG: cytochrome c [Neisseria zoodegmatis]|uniref:c-type cytochrome n=1 Tax=Neisseria zoodegmatis TaxID=326523 RepID=UPI0026ED8053|nr:cytochrome c [Neisseria zoodegmatis]MDO5070802.1 cytochrome c [Neisseria zoodegmatis]
MNKSLYTVGTLAALTLLAACGGQNNAQAPADADKAPAAATSPSAKASVEQREQLMEGFKKQMGAMAKMVKGEAPFDAAAFQKAADELDANAGKPWEHYTPESAKEESEAKPEIWSKPDEFKKEINKFTTAAAALKTAAASGKLDDVKKPFGEVGQSCKSCHDSFRNE